jgi:hypothetical protein
MIPCHAVAARRSTLLAEALHRVAASKYTCTRVLEHEPGTAAGAGRRLRIGTPPRPVQPPSRPDVQRDQMASNANRPGNSMRARSVSVRMRTAASDRTPPRPTSVTTMSGQL